MRHLIQLAKKILDKFFKNKKKLILVVSLPKNEIELMREKRIENLTDDIIRKYCCCQELKKVAGSQDFTKPGT